MKRLTWLRIVHSGDWCLRLAPHTPSGAWQKRRRKRHQKSTCTLYTSSHYNVQTTISDSLLSKLQTVQNAAARVVTGTRKFDHITPVLHQLHWVHQRITFKLAMITFKCLRGLAPSYLADACIPVSSVVGTGRCGRLIAGHSSCHVPGLRSVGETLLCQARQHGTAFPSNCGLHHCLLRRLWKNSKLIYSAASASEDFCLTGAI